MRKQTILILLLVLLMPYAPASAQSSTGALVVNYVEGAQLSGELAYEVHAFVSALDSNGNPIPALKLENFSAAEDSLPAQLLEADEVSDTPINLILAVDTSRSMSALGKIDAVKSAAAAFVSRLRPQDKVALVSFNIDPAREAELTTDHKLVTDRIALLSAVGSGTCLYNAARDAVTMASAVGGRRAVILLTDGRDEMVPANGTPTPCSSIEIDDVIDLAANTARVPIYTLGIGADADARGLGRMASLTGGLYAQVSGAPEIDAYFNLLSKQLSSQYELVYRSQAAPGAHQLVVTLNLNGTLISDSRSFTLPEPAAFPRIIAPTDGTKVSGSVAVAVSVQGKGDVSRLALLVNGAEVASDNSTPFEFRWDSGTFAGGAAALEAVIYDSKGAEIARSAPVTLVVLAPTAAPTLAPTSIPAITPTPPPASVFHLPANALVFGALGLLILAGLIFFAARWMQSHRRSEYVRWSGAADKPFANLIVEHSDSLPVGRRYDLRKPITSLGRSSENDIVLPDGPVSRRHAELREKDGALTVFEIKSEQDGKVQPPRYGTFVNEAAVPATGKALKHGDRLRIGSRTALRLERPETTPPDMTLDSLGSDRTFDSLSAPVAEGDADKTREWQEQETAPKSPPPDNTRLVSEEDRPQEQTADHTRQFGSADTLPPPLPEDSTRGLDSEDNSPPDDTRQIH